MATEQVIYVNPLSAGGDGTTPALSGANAAYASLSDAFDAVKVGTWAGAGLRPTIECAGAAADTVRINDAYASWDLSADSYLTIRAAASDWASPQWSTGKYRYSASISAYAMVMNNLDYVRFQGLQIEQTASGSVGGGVFVTPHNAANEIHVESCYIRSANLSSTSGFNYAQTGAVGTKAFYAVNNVIEGFTTGLNLADRSANVCYNNTLVNCTTGISATSTVGTCYFKNNLFSGCTTDILDGAGTDTCDYNATTNASLGSGLPAGTGNRLSQTFTFAGAGDYHLASGDAGAQGVGTDLSADANYPFAVDMEGDARTAPWDIGADQVAVPVTDDDPAHTTADVPATQLVGSPRTITVTARKSDGSNMTTGGATVVVTITGVNPQTPTVTDEGDGTYTCTYTTATIGADSVAITLDGTAIGGSPYGVTVVAGGSGGGSQLVNGGLAHA